MYAIRSYYDSQIKLIATDNIELATKLQETIKACVEIDSKVTGQLLFSKVITNLEFDLQWGLGSSSTLISLLAQWLKIDPYLLLSKTFKGSGYDIACANASSPILYELTERFKKVNPVDFKPPFIDQLYFVITSYSIHYTKLYEKGKKV